MHSEHLARPMAPHPTHIACVFRTCGFPGKILAAALIPLRFARLCLRPHAHRVPCTGHTKFYRCEHGHEGPRLGGESKEGNRSYK